MSRVLLAMVFAVGLAGSANAAVMQFSIGGVPVGPGEVVEVLPSDILMVDIYIDPEGQPYDGYVANIEVTGPWDPMPLDASGISWLPPFAQTKQYFTPTQVGNYVVSDNSQSTVTDPQGVCEWEVHVPDVPASTILNLEFVPSGMFGDTGILFAGATLPVTTLPLELHVTPEPATLGLLVLGGLAALRRRFA